MKDVIIVGAGPGTRPDVVSMLIAHDIQVLNGLALEDLTPEVPVYAIHARDLPEPYAIPVETLPPKGWYQRFAGRRGRAPRY